MQWKLHMQVILQKVSNFAEMCPKYIRDLQTISFYLFVLFNIYVS